MSKRRRNQPRSVNKASYGARAQAAGAAVRTISPAEQQQAAGLASMTGGQFQPLPRTEAYTVPFGPNIPIPPAEIDPLGPSGRSQPRQWEYPVGWNLPGFGERPIPWGTLRAASRVGVVRDCIRVVKTELCGLDWSIAVAEDAIATAMEVDGLRKTEAKRALRDRLAPDIARGRAFWTRPDPQGGHNFGSFLNMALEESLTLDALALYPTMTYGNDLFGIRVIDGSSVKPLLNNLGMRPSPPDPAFQSIMYGFPRGEYTAAANADGSLDGGYTADELIYCRREVRANSPYGISPVENALTQVNLWLKRVDWMTQQFDASSLPQALMELPESSSMNPAEMRRWRQAINDQLSGDLAERQRIQIGLPGGKMIKFGDNAELYKPLYDLHLIKLICAAFSITPAEIGFTEQGTLGGSSYHDAQENIQYRKMILPWCRWFQGIFNDIMVRYLGTDPAVEFRFLGLEEEDEAAADAVLQSRVNSGRMTVNEARDAMGLAPYEILEADEPMVVYGRGVLFLDGQKAIQDAQGMAQVAGANMAAQNLGQSDSEQDNESEDPEADESADGDDEASGAGEAEGGGGLAVKPPKVTEKTAATELDAFARWASRAAKGRTSPRRPFAFTAVDEQVGRQLNALAADGLATDAAMLAKTQAADLRKGPPGDGRGRGGGPPRPRAGPVARVPSPRPARPAVLGARLPGCPPAY